MPDKQNGSPNESFCLLSTPLNLINPINPITSLNPIQFLTFTLQLLKKTRLLKPAQYDEKELLALIALGNQAAFTQLFDRYRRKVLFIASDLLRSNEAAEDVLQNVFTKIWLNRARATEINQFSAYLNRMIRNEVFDLLRKKAYLDEFIGSNIDNVEGEEVHKFESREEFDKKQQRVMDAIKKLTPQQKRIVQLCGLEGHKQAEAAKLLGVSKETVKKHMADALKNIRTFLRDAAGLFFFF